MQMLREFFFPILKNSSFGTFFLWLAAVAHPGDVAGETSIVIVVVVNNRRQLKVVRLRPTVSNRNSNFYA